MPQKNSSPAPTQSPVINMLLAERARIDAALQILLQGGARPRRGRPPKDPNSLISLLRQYPSVTVAHI